MSTRKLTLGELKTSIRNHTGPVLCGVLCPDDVLYARVYKNDLLETLSRSGADTDPAPLYPQFCGDDMFLHSNR